MTTERVNVFNFDREALARFFKENGQPAFRSQQVFKWLYHEAVVDFAAMTNLPQSLRDYLSAHAIATAPVINYEKISDDGTVKWLMQMSDKQSVETVFIPEDDRGTLCISSQVGCALKCEFCSTGHQGFRRHLSTDEIIGQLWAARQRLWQLPEYAEAARPITNVVMMGMGEPLHNYDAVVPAMNIMMDDFGFGLSKRRVTLSTSGLVPAMKQLRKDSEAALAVSLHAPNDALRDRLVPINKKYPLSELIPVCRDYFKGDKKRVVTIEYVMLQEVNDTPAHAHELAELLQDVPCKVNLIPFNPFPGSEFERSSGNRIAAFKVILQASGLNTTVRKTRGEDIDAACGQLRGDLVRPIRLRRKAVSPDITALGG